MPTRPWHHASLPEPMRMYRRLIWPLLQRMDPERAHSLVMTLAQISHRFWPADALLNSLFPFQDIRLQVTWRGMTFRNPVGLAAGLDKDALAPHVFQALGFGFIEVGSVTPRSQPGNPKPRVHRLPNRLAMVNNMGFPSKGALAMAERLARRDGLSVPLGINLGKNLATPLDLASLDYVSALDVLYVHGDYFVLNVSSPNTIGLTSLQARPALAAVVGAISARRNALAAGEGSAKPLLVKVSPDLSLREVSDVLDVALVHGVDGIIATNTSAYTALKRDREAIAGGLSGAPLAGRSVRMVEHLRREAPDLFIVGVGGVFSGDDAWALLQAGADVVQLYTGLIYRGPGLVNTINRQIVARMDREGVDEIGDLRRR